MKALYDTLEQKVKPYPRSDDEPVVDLDPRYLTLTVTQEPQPPITEGETLTATENLDLNALTVTYGWQINPAPTPPSYKIWISAQQFMAEFTMDEKAQIALSTDPTVAALRLEISTWFSNVYGNDLRVTTGLDKLVQLGIITQTREDEILAL